MAGIGFALDRLYRSGSIADNMISFAHAAVLAAGPCLLSVLCIWLIGSLTSEVEGHTTVVEFRALVIYGFALSFIVTSPITLVSARLVSDRLHDRNVGGIPGVMLAALGLSGAATMVFAVLVFGVALALDPREAVAAVMTCAMIAFVWVACLFCGVTRDYNAVTGFFAAGMLVALIAVTAGYRVAPRLDGMLWGFSAGLAVTLFGLIVRIVATFPFAVRDLMGPIRALSGGILRYWPIALGGLFAASGVWIDKFIIWLSPFGQEIGPGIKHAPLYDSAMFISYLVAVPAYAGFVIHLEVTFFRNYRMFYSSILDHATLGQIRRNGARLRDDTIASLIAILVPQLAICAVVAASAPAVIEALDMQFRQVGTLRLGVIGALLQFLFVTCSSLTLYFDRRLVFLATQACFFLCNAALTSITLMLGQPYLGLGFLLAAAVSAIFAYLALVRTLYRLDYLTFIANNPAVRMRADDARPRISCSVGKSSH